MSGFKQQSNGN